MTMLTMNCIHTFTEDGLQLFTDRETGAQLLLDAHNRRAQVTIGDHVTVYRLEGTDFCEELGLLLEHMKQAAK